MGSLRVLWLPPKISWLSLVCECSWLFVLCVSEQPCDGQVTCPLCTLLYPASHSIPLAIITRCPRGAQTSRYRWYMTHLTLAKQNKSYLFHNESSWVSHSPLKNIRHIIGRIIKFSNCSTHFCPFVVATLNDLYLYGASSSQWTSKHFTLHSVIHLCSIASVDIASKHTEKST